MAVDDLPILVGADWRLAFGGIPLAEDFDRQRNRGQQADATKSPTYGLALFKIQLVSKQ